MKKIALFLSFILIPVLCFASIVSYTTLSGDSGVSYSHLNSSFTTLYNDYNGNINSDNIANGTISSSDIATASNPLKRDGENIGEYVYTGMTIPTSASLSSTTVAGTAYVKNDADGYLHRVETAATAHTYTASKDTYVFVDYTGAFAYTEVALGAATPVTPANSIILAKVVTDATTVASVSDLAQRTPTNLRTYTDYKNGCVLSKDSAGSLTKIYVNNGEIELGNVGKVRRNTTNTALDFTTTGRGGLDTGSLAASTYYYIFALPDDGSDTGFDVIASTSSTDAASVSDERLIGYCWANAASSISQDVIGAYRGKGGDAPNVLDKREAGISYSMNANANIVIHTARFYSSGRPLVIHHTAVGTSGGDTAFMSEISIDSVTTNSKAYCATATASEIDSTNGVFVTTLSPGPHTINLTVTNVGSSGTLIGYSLTAIEQ